MHNKYIYSNIIGTFVFNEHFKPMNSIMFKNTNEYAQKEKYEKDFSKKYSHLKKPEGKELEKILEYFKKPEYFKEFRTKNIVITRQLIKKSVKDELLIIQAINNISDIDKAINTLTKRLREWYELYNPEFSHSIDKQELFVELIMKKNKQELLQEINEKNSMGADFSKEDLEPIMNLAKKIQGLLELRFDQENYLEKIMKKVCPNMLAITGITTGAKLLSQAGSIKKMVEFPASTIQLLGAEKALFRHLTSKAKSPKYGFLHEHPLIMKNKQKLHGKIARALADKISIAIKVDYFKGKFIGNELINKLEKKWK
ncbi:MAG: hypothetical protein ABIC04_08590 [Nanoarchaeota archaeon]